MAPLSGRSVRAFADRAHPYRQRPHRPAQLALCPAARWKFILRFDDTDLERSRKEYADAIEADWIGLEFGRIWCAASPSGWRSMRKPPPGLRIWAGCTRLMRRRRNSNVAGSGSRRSAGRRSMIAPPCASCRRAGRARSVRPRAALAFSPRTDNRTLERHGARR